MVSLPVPDPKALPAPPVSAPPAALSDLSTGHEDQLSDPLHSPSSATNAESLPFPDPKALPAPPVSAPSAALPASALPTAPPALAPLAALSDLCTHHKDQLSDPKTLPVLSASSSSPPLSVLSTGHEEGNENTYQPDSDPDNRKRCKGKLQKIGGKMRPRGKAGDREELENDYHGNVPINRDDKPASRRKKAAKNASAKAPQATAVVTSSNEPKQPKSRKRPRNSETDQEVTLTDGRRGMIKRFK